MEGLLQCSANYVPLTPISFLDRAARVYPQKISIVHGDVTFTWKLTHQRCTKLASALSSKLGVCYGDVVAVVAPNVPELYELHFSVPMAGGVLSTLNPDLDTSTLSLIMEELESKIVFLHHQCVEKFLKVLKLLQKRTRTLPLLVILNSDVETTILSSCSLEKLPLGSLLYNVLLDMGQFDFEPLWPRQECDPVLVNYTSGSTGHPKGVVYSHRAAYLNALGEILQSDLRGQRIVFMWTADMFRANGWGFTWAIAALGGTNVCFGRSHILDTISLHGVTHLSGHPSILLKVLEEAHNKCDRVQLPHKVYAHIAGVLPSTDDVLIRVKDLGFEVILRYGMTEVLGPPVTRLLWKSDHVTNALNSHVDNNIVDHLMEELDVKDPHTMNSVPCDGKTIGEVMFRGNALMMGYLKAPSQTKKVFQGGWFHTGDLAVRRQDGRIQLKDRAKDIIKVSKEECISTLEIEDVMHTHPKVIQAAVVGMPNSADQLSKFEVPCAFLKLKNGAHASQGEIVRFCSARLPVTMVPKLVIFGDLAISSTGKVQKFILREVAKTMSCQHS